MKVVILILLASRIVVGPLVAAADPVQGEKLAAEGQVHYNKAEFDLAAAKFEAAYAKDPDPAYVYNLAQALRLGRKCARAASEYKRFLEIVSDAPNADEVKGYIQAMEDCTPKPTDPIRKDEPIKQPSVSPPIDRGKEAGMSGRRKAAIGIGAAGLVLLGTGVAFGLDAISKANEKESLCRESTCTWDDSYDKRSDYLESAGKRNEKIAIGAYVVGGLALAGSITLYMLGGRESPVSVAPTSGGATATATFRF